MIPHAIEIIDLSKHYSELHALKQINLTIEQGEFFALLGPNGAGKTTLISTIAGLTKPTQGSALVMGFDVVKAYPLSRRAIGVVPQELVFDPFFTVRETLQWQSGYFGIQHNDDWIDEILSHLGLLDKANANMRTLSGGMKRRVMVAQALVHKPPVIVLDEPTAGVDVALRQTLWQFIQSLNRQGHTILLTTHYLEEAETLCNRVAIINQGELVTVAPTQTLLSQFNQSVLSIRLQTDAVTAQTLAQTYHGNLTPSATINEFFIDIQYDTPIKAANIIEHFAQTGQLLDFETRKVDLETVFLQLTQKKPSTL